MVRKERPMTDRFHKPAWFVMAAVAVLLFDGKAIFGSLPSDEEAHPEPFEISPRSEPQEFTILKDVQSAYLVIGYPTPRIHGTPDEYALDVAGSILGEGKSSWLYQILKEEKGLVTDVDSFFWSLEWAGLFGLEAACEEEDLPRVERILFEQVERLRRGEFTDAEIQKAKNQIISDFAFGTEKASSISGIFGEYEVTSKIEDAIHYTDRIRQVSREQIMDALGRHLSPNGYTKGVLKPQPKEEV